VVLPDGNGRTARLLMNYQLMRNGFVPISIPVKMKEHYFYSLEEYHNSGKCDQLIKMLAELEKKEIIKVIGTQKKS